MITLIFDPQLKTPMYEQLYRFVRTEIENGKLKRDEKLPSKRKLAVHLKISTVTVETAYAQLEAEGYIKTVPKSGYYVLPFEGHTAYASPSQKKTLPPAGDTNTTGKYDYDFKTNVVDTELFPFATWAKLAREVLAENSNELLNVTHPQGSPALRREIAEHLYKFRGITASPEQIVVGAGSEYLIVLLIQLLGRTGTYALENPCYGKIFKIFKSNGIATVPVELDEQGLSVAKLEKTHADTVHVTPSHQFPLGIVMPVGRRMSLLKWAGESDNRYIIEDDYDSEFRFTGQPIPALKGLDREDRVVYINAFTKSLAPSLRISYVVLPHRLMDLYRENFLFYSCTVPNFEQYTLCKFLSGGYFERHLSRMRKAYKERRDIFISAVTQSKLATVTEIVGADAGLHFLMIVKNGMSESELVARARKAGVNLYGLSGYYNFTVRELPGGTLVIGYSGVNPDNIAAGVKRLEDAWCNTKP
jgi:GntR family transcriptional regulator / MocR family aminotransferase